MTRIAILLFLVACYNQEAMISAKNVHIIGIGGIGTSAVAKWWQAQGAIVTGSDVHKNELISELEKIGIEVFLGHFAENIPNICDLVIHSRAVLRTNVERQVATERGIINLSYPEFLGELAKVYKTIAISGTNGKSTTTAMIASILIEAGFDPTVVVGTQVPNWPMKNLRIGNGKWFVTEACEHMASFLNIHPDIAVITNIEEDHLDFYTDLDQIRDTFQIWIDRIKAHGVVVLNANDSESKKLKLKKFEQFVIQNRETKDCKQTFSVLDNQYMISLPGEFNAMNAAAAVVACKIAGVSAQIIQKALSEFGGTWRRFELVGKWKEADVYSDYAHHPIAIQATLRAAKEFFIDRRLIVVFEPHQHSRTHELFEEFVDSFGDADVVVISEIYEVVGRTEEKFESSRDLVEKISKRLPNKSVIYASDLKQAESELRDVVKKGDVIFCMGAGAIDSLARKLAG